jgi:site-specific DNA-methyltransferase (adenine-specific)
MENHNLPLDQILHGDCIEILNSFPDKSIDVIFADPPYNLQLHQELWRPNRSKVEAVDDDWDKFEDLRSYDQFCLEWLAACRRVLKDTGTIWVIGSYHNIYRIGSLMQNLDFWFLNDIVWIKSNPMPNFRGVRFTNAHETLIWACKSKGSKYTFNHFAMKSLNGELQMRSDWVLPICTGSERIRVNGKKAHSTQKPEALLYRVILASSNPGDVVLDPFFGSGTTGVIAIKLHRHWIGIEKEERYIQVATERINSTHPEAFREQVFDVRNSRQREPRIPFSSLVEDGLITPGQPLYFQGDLDKIAHLKPDGRLRYGDLEGSIHQIGRLLSENTPCNGWEVWYYEDMDHKLHPINELRNALRQKQEYKIPDRT